MDFDFYINRYRDVKIRYGRSRQLKSNLVNHYINHGIFQGRQISKVATRNGLQNLLETYSSKSILEIGPFTNPIVRGKNVKYFDVGNKEYLIEKATQMSESERLKFSIENIPDIDFVDPNGNLSTVNQKFDVIVSSHSIEHQPNLIDHLNKVSSLLNSGGEYYVNCPDKRYSFDYYNNLTKLIDVVSADIEKRVLHPIRNLFEGSVCITHNNAIDHWMGNHGALPSGEYKLERIKSLAEKISQNRDSYIDVHSWYFTPLNFAMIIKELNSLSLIDIGVAKIYPTVVEKKGFVAILKRLVET